MWSHLLNILLLVPFIGCIGFLVLLDSEPWDRPLVWLCVSAMGVGGYIYGLKHYRRKKLIDYTPTSKAIGVAPGITELSGKARRHAQSVVAPYSKRECLFYVTELYQCGVFGGNKSPHRKLVLRVESPHPITLEDETGGILVKPELADFFRPHCDLKYRARLNDGRGFVPFPERSASLYQFVQEFRPELLNSVGEFEVEETCIADGDQIFVFGTTELGGDPDSPEIIVRNSNHGTLFVFSKQTEGRIRFHLDALSSLLLLFGPPAALVGYLALLNHWEVRSGIARYYGVIVALALYFGVVLVQLLEMYNGLIQLKVNIERARANVDALLKMRQDLISQLCEVVNEYRQHERQILDRIRSFGETAIGHTRQELKLLEEEYPYLRSSDAFYCLQEQLAITEARLVASRAFVNDSIAVYNGHLETLPYNILAEIVGLKAKQFLTWTESPERVVPS